MTIYAPTLAIDMVAPESAAPYLAIAADKGAKRTLTPREIDDMRYRVAWAFEHGGPMPLSARELFALLAMVPNPAPATVAHTADSVRAACEHARICLNSDTPTSMRGTLPHLTRWIAHTDGGGRVAIDEIDGELWYDGRRIAGLLATVPA